MPEQSSEEMTAQSSVAIMDRLANALERLSSAQPAAAKRADFKAPDFSGPPHETHSRLPPICRGGTYALRLMAAKQVHAGKLVVR